MKKIRILLSASALVIGMGAAFGSMLLTTETGYREINGACEQVKNCQTSGTPLCEDSGFTLYRVESNNTCSSTPLKRIM